MFKKPFRVKTNTQLKGSDTKKLKIKLLKCFESLTEESLSCFLPNKETVYAAKIMTHSGEIVHLYCIQKLPIIFEVNDEVYPTVYMLWQFPDLIPVFTTYPQVLSAISGGADLMLPGVVLPESINIKSYGNLEKGARVSVNLTSNIAPIAVGKAALSSFDMYMAARRGKCVNILHVYGDTLSNYGSTLPIPELGPVAFFVKSDEIQSSDEADLTEVAGLTLNQNVNNSSGTHEDNEEHSDHVKTEAVDEEKVSEVIEGDEINDDVHNEDTEALNELLMYCFLKSVKTSIKKNVLPLLASTFYKQHMLASCPPGKNIDIKKTKYKKLSNFLSELENFGIIRLETVSKGVQRISSVSLDHEVFKGFGEKYAALEQLAASSRDTNSQLSDKPVAPEIKEKYTVTAAVLPLFSIYLNKKGDSLTMESIRKCVTEYVRVENLKDNENKKNVKLNKLLKDIIGSDIESASWDILISGIVKKMGSSYEVSSVEMKPTVVKGKLQPIDIQVGTRVGNKKVTLVSNLELYGINVKEFAQECQHGVGASTTINNIPSSKSAQVQIQGNQVIFVNKLLIEKYSIQKRYIRGLENAPKKKK